MNKRQREILAELRPAVDFALERGGKRELAPLPEARKVPGLHMTARLSANAPTELSIYGRIGGGGWFDEGISASDVAALLREAGPGPIDVRLNSPGGDVFDGVAIHSLLARHPGTVTVYVDGLAASAASFIMLAGDRIVSARNAFVMIHDAMTGTYGNRATHAQAMELLDKVSENIADMYAERAGEDPAYWRNLMTERGEDGTWYTGQEALDAGLVDELTVIADEDGEDENYAVASRLIGWEAQLGEKARTFLHSVQDNLPDGEEEAGEEEATEEPAPEPDPATDHDFTDEDNDFAHSMAMWAWMNNNPGRTARKEAA